MNIPKLWAKKPDGTKGFAISHVKSIFYNKHSGKMLNQKLDEMDAATDNRILKTDISGTQTSASDKVPSSALVNTMNNTLNTAFLPRSNTITDCNDAKQPGIYSCNNTVKNGPFAASGFWAWIEVMKTFTSDIEIVQRAISRQDGANNGVKIIAYRTYGSNAWTPWRYLRTMETGTLPSPINRSDLLNSAFVESTPNAPSVMIIKWERTVTMSIFFQAKSLTGSDVIISSLPSEYCPLFNLNGFVTARTNGSWASAVQKPASMLIEPSGKVSLHTNVADVSSIQFVDGYFTYITNENLA